MKLATLRGVDTDEWLSTTTDHDGLAYDVTLVTDVDGAESIRLLPVLHDDQLHTAKQIVAAVRTSLLTGRCAGCGANSARSPLPADADGLPAWLPVWPHAVSCVLSFPLLFLLRATQDGLDPWSA